VRAWTITKILTIGFSGYGNARRLRPRGPRSHTPAGEPQHTGSAAFDGPLHREAGTAVADDKDLTASSRSCQAK